MNPLDMVKLTALMERTSGTPEVVIGLIDGPVTINHPDLADAHIREIPGRLAGTCAQANSAACMHATFVAGILCARRTSSAPAICPNCTLLLRPIFGETPAGNGQMISATPTELATAIIESIEAGAHILNLSASLAQPSSTSQRDIEEALDYAAQRGVIVVAASGNQGALGSSPITRHPWVIPVAAYDLAGRPMTQSNLGRSIGRWGLGAPGDNIMSLGAAGNPRTLSGTSVAAPFVTGAVALLRSLFPAAPAAEVKFAISQQTSASRRTAVVPPLLDTWAAYQLLEKSRLMR